jgi:oligopeptide transport system permease protein
MGWYIIKRTLIGILTLFALITITYFMMKAIPGNPYIDEKKANDVEYILAINKKYGFDKPVIVQYGMYLGNMVRGDFGNSIDHRGYSVISIIADGAPLTFIIGIIAAVFSLVVGILLGLVSALSKRKSIDRFITILTTIGISVPSFLIAIGLLILFGVKLNLVSIIWKGKPSNFILPIIALSLYPIAMITKLTKTSMQEVSKKDYLTLAKAKGATSKKIIYGHALKNALIPVITYAGPMVAYLLTGSFVIERIFSIPGIGGAYVSSIGNRDYPMIMATTFLLGTIIIIFNIISDLTCALVDPRIKLGG